MENNSRTKRINAQLKQEIVLAARSIIKDSRASMISVTTVEAVKDLSHAKVYITYLGTAEERPEVIQLLNDSSGKIRTLLGKTLRLRTIPKLIFIYDDLLEKSSYIDSLIKTAINQDMEKAKTRDDDDN